jgi:hypothetical protein
MNLRYISLGHRCHVAQILKLNKLTYHALPFDGIIYLFDGVIDCIENNFINFFPKEIVCEYVFVGKTHPEADDNGNRKLFRGKYGSFTHHDLNNETIINTFQRRIQRFNDYLSVTSDEVIFIRTVMEDNEIDKLNKFIDTVKNSYPNLKFKIFLVYDNKNMPEIILKYNEYAYVANSIMLTLDQNLKTNPTAYCYLFNYLKNINTFNDIRIDDLISNNSIIFKNDSFKGYAITNLIPYNTNN